MLGCVIVRTFILKLRYFTEHVEAMGETRRHPKHSLVLVGDVLAYPLAKGGRALADVHSHVEDLPNRCADEFPLGLPDLVVETAECTLARAAVIILDKVRIDTGLDEFPTLPCLHEESTFVAEDIGFYEKDIGDAGWDEIHGGL